MILCAEDRSADQTILTGEHSVTEFRVELAGVPIGIRCGHRENKSFLKAYLTDKEPLFTVETKPEDLIRAQEEFDRLDKAEGREPFLRPDLHLENVALHRLLAERLTEYDVLLMHGSALALDGEGYLFTAPSGTGKSTHARLWREMFGDRVFMVNDDKPLLKIREDGAWVCGTPWDGKHGLSRNAIVPLRAIAILERSDRNSIAPLAKEDAFPALVTQAFASKDPAIMMRIMTLEKRLLDRIEFYKLRCNMEPDAARIACEGMKSVLSR